MKKLYLSFLCLFTVAVVCAQDNYNEQQRKVRSNYLNFLREEGYSPQIDEDGEIKFKVDGNTFWLYIRDGSRTWYIQLQMAGYEIDDEDLLKCIYAANETTRGYKVGKAYVSSNGKSVIFVMQAFLKNEEEFKYIFYRFVDGLKEMKQDFKEKYNNAPDWVTSNSSPSTSYNSSSATSYSNVSSTAVFNKLFPVYNITIGKTTLREIEKMDYPIKTTSTDSKVKYSIVNGINIYDFDKDNIVDYFSIDKYDYMPEKWQALGFNWNKSFNEWIDILSSLGFSVKITKGPETVKDEGRNTLSADLTATSGNLELRFAFKFGNTNNEGYSRDSKRSLYSIVFDF